MILHKLAKILIRRKNGEFSYLPVRKPVHGDVTNYLAIFVIFNHTHSISLLAAASLPVIQIALVYLDESSLVARLSHVDNLKLVQFALTSQLAGTLSKR